MIASRIPEAQARLDAMDGDFLRRVAGRRWRDGVEFEEQCALRGFRFRGLFELYDGRIHLTAAGRAAIPALRGESK